MHLVSNLFGIVSFIMVSNPFHNDSQINLLRPYQLVVVIDILKNQIIPFKNSEILIKIKIFYLDI